MPPNQTLPGARSVFTAKREVEERPVPPKNAPHCQRCQPACTHHLFNPLYLPTAQISITASLALGSMVFNARRAGQSAVPGSATRAIMTTNDLMTQLAEAKTHDDVMLAIHAIGNAGSPTAIKMVLPYMTSTLSPKVQVAAVRAVRRMDVSDADVQQARKAVMERICDNDAHETVRMAAIKALAMNNPSGGELNTMANAVISPTFAADKSPQVDAYARRTLRSLSRNDPEPTLRRTARDLLDALQSAGGFVDFSGTNLTQLNVRLGFEKDDEYFFVGDNEWGGRLKESRSMSIPLALAICLLFISFRLRCWPCLVPLPCYSRNTPQGLLCPSI